MLLRVVVRGDHEGPTTAPFGEQVGVPGPALPVQMGDRFVEEEGG